MSLREGKQQRCVCPNVLGLICVYLCLLFVFLGHQNIPKSFRDDFKERVQKYLCIKQRGWEQCEVALHKVALCTRPIERCPCASFPCQRILGLNCVYLCLLFAFLGHQKQMQLLAMISKEGFKISLHKAKWVGTI